MFTINDQMLEYPARPLPLVMETTRWKPNNVDLAPNCPRCASSNTKFCYYNNYSLSQPRYFCKGCRRYWTKGGSLRNVPVGGGCRKSRRSKSFRPPRTERSVSTTTYSGDIDIINTGNSAHTPNDPFSINEDPSSKINGQDIDLAVVFAKFLNQNSSHDDEIVGHELAGEANLLQNSTISVDESDIIGLEQGLIEGHRPSDFLTECQLIDVYAEDQEKRQEEEEKIRQKNNVYSMEGLFSNENDQVLVENAIWSDAETIPNFMVQLQELETAFMASSDDQLKMSANLISDRGSSFDLPSYEVFSGP